MKNSRKKDHSRLLNLIRITLSYTTLKPETVIYVVFYAPQFATFPMPLKTERTVRLYSTKFIITALPLETTDIKCLFIPPHTPPNHKRFLSLNSLPQVLCRKKYAILILLLDFNHFNGCLDQYQACYVCHRRFRLRMRISIIALSFCHNFQKDLYEIKTIHFTKKFYCTSGMFEIGLYK